MKTIVRVAGIVLSLAGLGVLALLAIGVLTGEGAPTGYYRSVNADGSLSELRRYVTPTPATGSIAASRLSCTHVDGILIRAEADNRGRAAKGTIRNTCTRDVRVEYTLTGIDKDGRVLTGPVRRTAYLRTNEAQSWYYDLYPDGREGDMVIVHHAIVQVVPS